MDVCVVVCTMFFTCWMLRLLVLFAFTPYLSVMSTLFAVGVTPAETSSFDSSERLIVISILEHCAWRVIFSCGGSCKNVAVRDRSRPELVTGTTAAGIP